MVGNFDGIVENGEFTEFGIVSKLTILHKRGIPCLKLERYDPKVSKMVQQYIVPLLVKEI